MVKLKVLDLTGREIMAKDFSGMADRPTNKFILDLSSYKNGSYMLLIQTERNS